MRYIARTSSAELPRRRLAGSSAAFDREYFVFLESVRRTLPAGAHGVALFLPAPAEPAWYLAAYDLAPRPVVLSPREAPPGWAGAVYGPSRPPGWSVVRELPGGALLSPDRESSSR